MNNPTDTNQASEVKRNSLNKSDRDVKLESIIRSCIDDPHDRTIGEAKAAIQSIIRTEKLKLLDRLSSHQEDLFWWTGGEYEKTNAVDMRAIAAERELLTKLEAEL